MKALKDCRWYVEILQLTGGDTYFWTCENDDFGTDPITSNMDSPTKKDAINSWKEFAQINGITNYKIMDTP